ncbi:hypothetical protein HDU67_004742 [Dinochytrium kinnereticum]|nr:hypothetical protein HDU67_004742 [Dinochytrium kinnereticum]
MKTSALLWGLTLLLIPAARYAHHTDILQQRFDAVVFTTFDCTDFSYFPICKTECGESIIFCDGPGIGREVPIQGNHVVCTSMRGTAKDEIPPAVFVMADKCDRSSSWGNWTLPEPADGRKPSSPFRKVPPTNGMGLFIPNISIDNYTSPTPEDHHARQSTWSAQGLNSSDVDEAFQTDLSDTSRISSAGKEAGLQKQYVMRQSYQDNWTLPVDTMLAQQTRNLIVYFKC